MRPLADLIADFRAAARSVPADTLATLVELGEAVEHQAKDMIGTHQPIWAPLQPETVDKKRRKGWGRDGDPSSPLYATGEFQRSVKSEITGPFSVLIYSDDPAAQYHEYGTAHQPPRPVFLPAAKVVLRRFWVGNQISKLYLRQLRK